MDDRHCSKQNQEQQNEQQGFMLSGLSQLSSSGIIFINPILSEQIV